MAVSIAELIILSLIAAWLLQRLGIPGLIGMLMVGVVAGPYGLDLLDPRLLAVGADLRLIALIVILLRAGFEISRQTLHRVGGRTLLLALIPSTVEGLAVCALAPWLLGLSYLESAVLGWVLAAVSPAVVVPMMTRFIQTRRGAEKGIPTMILAAASVRAVQSARDEAGVGGGRRVGAAGSVGTRDRTVGALRGPDRRDGDRLGDFGEA